MQKWTAITAILVLSILLSGCIRDMLWDYGHYSRDMERYFDTEEERNAIEAAENLNYTFYTNLSRWEDDWANYVDTEVIDHFNGSYTQAKEVEEDADINFDYFAWAEFYPQMDLRIKGDRWEMVVRVNGDDPFKDHDEKDIYYYLDYEEMFLGHEDNGTWTVDKFSSVSDGPYRSDVDLYLHFNDTFFVKMYLSYDYIWGPLAAIYVETFQFVVLDEDLNVLVIGVHPSPWMVS